MGKLLYLLIFLFFSLIGSCEHHTKKKNAKEGQSSIQLKTDRMKDFT